MKFNNDEKNGDYVKLQMKHKRMCAFLTKALSIYLISFLFSNNNLT